MLPLLAGIAVGAGAIVAINNREELKEKITSGAKTAKGSVVEAKKTVVEKVKDVKKTIDEKVECLSSTKETKSKKKEEANDK